MASNGKTTKKQTNNYGRINMKNTKIEWADATLNPVIGCKHGCPYCYAKYMNKRFGFTPNFEEPTFFPERL